MYYYNGAQRYKQFLKVTRLYQALILLGLALCLYSLPFSELSLMGLVMRWWRRTVSRLLMMMSITIALVLCHSVSQEAVDTREQLNSTLIRLTPQTEAGIVVTS